MQTHSSSDSIVSRDLLKLGRAALAVLMMMSLPGLTGCPTLEVEAKGESSAKITIPGAGLKIKLKGPLTIPESFPAPLGGITLDAEAEIELDLPPGKITIEDELDIGCAGQDNGAASTAVCDVRPSSTYTFALPGVLGSSNSAFVSVAGQSVGVADIDAFELVPGTDPVGDGEHGRFVLDNAGIGSWSHTLTGAGPVWAAPLTTPHGVISGTGSLELADFMIAFDGTTSGVSFEFDTRTRSYAAYFPIEIDFSGDVLSGYYYEQGWYAEGQDVPAIPAALRLLLAAGLLGAGAGAAWRRSRRVRHWTNPVVVLSMAGLLTGVPRPGLSEDVIHSSYMAGYNAHIAGEQIYWNADDDLREVAVPFTVVVPNDTSGLLNTDFRVTEISVTIDYVSDFDGNTTVTLDLMEPDGFGEPGAVIASSDITSLIDSSVFFGPQRIVVNPSPQPLVEEGDYYYVRLSVRGVGEPSFGPSFEWLENSAGVGTATEPQDHQVFDSFFGAWTVGLGDHPVLKVLGTPVFAFPAQPSFTSYATLGPSSSTVSATLYPEYFCPARESQFWCAATVTISPGQSSAQICREIESAINQTVNNSVCYAPLSETPPANHGFVATCSGNSLRVLNHNALCSGGFVCADAIQGLESFLKSLAHENDQVGGPLILSMEGAASGVAEDAGSPPGVHVVHTLRDPGTGTESVYEAAVSLSAGMTPAEVAGAVAAALQGAGDGGVEVQSGRLVFEPPVGEELVIDQQNQTIGSTLQIQFFSPIGQSFTPTLNRLDAVELRVVDFGGSSGATLEVRIREDDIDGPIIATSIPLVLPNGLGHPAVSRFEFPAPVELVPGNTYVLEPVVVSGDAWGILHGPDGYGGGHEYLSGVPDSGDLWFRLGVLTPGTQDIAYKINDTGLGWAMTPLDVDPFSFLSGETTRNLLTDAQFPVDTELVAFLPPTIPDVWRAESASIESGTVDGISPLSPIPPGMLRVNQIGGVGSQVQQTVDVSPYAYAIDAGLMGAMASATFNCPTSSCRGTLSIGEPGLGAFPDGTAVLEPLDSDAGTWERLALEDSEAVPVPPGTRSVFLQVSYTNTTIPSDGYVDEATLQLRVVPEPSTAVALAAGAVALWRLSRRHRRTIEAR